MNFGLITEFGFCIMLFDCLGVGEGFGFEYVFCLGCRYRVLYLRLLVVLQGLVFLCDSRGCVDFCWGFFG
jgi:hypothetical protein